MADRDGRRGRVDRQRHIHRPTITAAIPPVFESYATVVLPYAGESVILR
jgi:hypothetical protein